MEIIGITDIQKQTILFVILLLFVFFIYSFFVYWNDPPHIPIKIAEPFSELLPNHVKISHPLMKHNGNNWWNHYTEQPHLVPTPIKVEWNQLKWDDTNISYKQNDNFTVSFWIYINEVSDFEQIVFRVSTHISTRMPGIFIPERSNTLAIRCSTQATPDDGKSIQEERDSNIIPLKTPTYFSVVFTKNKYILYMNGVHKTEYKWKTPPLNIQNVQSAMVELGTSSTKKTFVIYNLQLYNAFTQREIEVLYRQRIAEFNRQFTNVDQARTKANEIMNVPAVSSNETVQENDSELKSIFDIYNTDLLSLSIQTKRAGSIPISTIMRSSDRGWTQSSLTPKRNNI